MPYNLGFPMILQMNGVDAVDGCEILHQLLVNIPWIFWVSPCFETTKARVSHREVKLLAANWRNSQGPWSCFDT